MKVNQILVTFLILLNITLVNAGTPVWSFKPRSATNITVYPNSTSTVSYQVTNQSRKSHSLVMTPIPGVTQIINAGTCSSPFKLSYQQSCTLRLQVRGNDIHENIVGGPVVCEQGNPLKCYQPSYDHILNISVTNRPEVFYQVTSLGDAHVTATPALRRVPSGYNTTFIVSPKTGYSVKVNSSCGGGDLTGTTYTTNAITHNCSVLFSSQPLSILTAAGAYYKEFPGFATQNNGDTWTEGVVAVNGNYTINSTSCIDGANTFCTAVGQDDDDSPLLFQSFNGGANWSPVSLPTISASLNSTSCTGTGNTALCTVVGQGGDLKPVLYQSINGGATWNPVTTSSAEGKFYATSCTGSDNTALCTAVGFDNNSQSPLVYQSKNGGRTWSPVNINDQGFFQAINCTGNDNTICVAVGQRTNNTPLLYQSINGGTWERITINEQGNFNSTSCAISASSICTAVGQDVNFAPLLYQSINRGPWNRVNINTQGYLNATSCTKTGTTALCTAVGSDLSTNLALIYQSLDGGITWNSVSLNDGGIFNATSCSGTGINALCTAAGSQGYLPLLYQSRDGGLTWSPVTIAKRIGTLNTTSCKGMVCTSLGGFSYSTPLLSISVDGGTHWTKALLDVDYGNFNSSSCTG
ncbi:MAG: hypothetical protein PSV35_02305, partial [bacterium]|nr:hypothetical protein [bacterium]